MGAAIWFAPVPDGVKPAAWKLLAIFVATIIGFILRPLPIGAVAFTSISFSVLSGILKPGEALSGFGTTLSGLLSLRSCLPKGSSKPAWADVLPIW